VGTRVMQCGEGITDGGVEVGFNFLTCGSVSW
jgi:hypothetical protein